MINPKSILNVERAEQPFPFYKYKNLIDPIAMAKLLSEYPSWGFQSVSKNNIDKSYSFSINNLIIEDKLTEAYDNLSPIWKTFIDSLANPDYKVLIGQSIGRDILNKKISIAFYQFNDSNWVSPHLDKKNKLFTQLFYFNDQWSEEWGGQLKLLKYPDKENNDFLSILPNNSHSILLPRTDAAWHMVNPVTSKALFPRKTLQFEVWDYVENLSWSNY